MNLIIRNGRQVLLNVPEFQVEENELQAVIDQTAPEKAPSCWRSAARQEPEREHHLSQPESLTEQQSGLPALCGVVLQEPLLLAESVYPTLHPGFAFAA